MNNTAISLLVVEDHELTRLGLRLALESKEAIGTIYEASTANGALDMAVKHQPDVIIMDIGLPDLDGISITRKLKEVCPDSRLIMLTSHNSDEDLFASFAAGADGYCMKSAPTPELAMAIFATACGASWLDPRVANRVLRALPKQASTFKASMRSCAELSEREREVLRLMVEGLTNPQIAESLIVSVETVKTHVRHVMEKLQVSDRTQAAVKATREKLI